MRESYQEMERDHPRGWRFLMMQEGGVSGNRSGGTCVRCCRQVRWVRTGNQGRREFLHAVRKTPETGALGMREREGGVVGTVSSSRCPVESRTQEEGLALAGSTQAPPQRITGGEEEQGPDAGRWEMWNLSSHSLSFPNAIGTRWQAADADGVELVV